MHLWAAGVEFSIRIENYGRYAAFSAFKAKQLLVLAGNRAGNDHDTNMPAAEYPQRGLGSQSGDNPIARMSQNGVADGAYKMLLRYGQDRGPHLYSIEFYWWERVFASECRNARKKSLPEIQVRIASFWGHCAGLRFSVHKSFWQPWKFDHYSNVP
jgi:hypothetical protein